MLCDYGCGQEAIHQFKNGNWCCSKNIASCPEKIRLKKEFFKNETKEEKNIRIEKHKKSHNTESFKNKQSNSLKKYYKDNEDALEKNRNNVKNFYKNETKDEKKIRVENQKISHSGKKYKKQASIKSKRTIKQIKKMYPIFTIDEEIRYKPGLEKERIIQAHCKNHNCPNSKDQGGWFTPTSSQIDNRIASLDRYGEGNGYMYCSEECKQSCDLYGKRVSQLMITENDCKFPYTRVEYIIWREEVFKRAGYKCEYCGQEAEDAHHSKPQKLNPGLALDPDYGIACCKKCHNKYGHSDRECTYGYIANK